MAANTRNEEAFDFDDWSELARLDPKAFDCRRRAAIAAVLSRSWENSRLAGLQWRIDMERRRCRTPLKACLKISALMWASFYELEGLLRAYREGTGTRRRKERARGEVVAFRAAHSSAGREDCQ
jgi:hypothetical protein